MATVTNPSDPDLIRAAYDDWFAQHMEHKLPPHKDALTDQLRELVETCTWAAWLFSWQTAIETAGLL